MLQLLQRTTDRAIVARISAGDPQGTEPMRLHIMHRNGEILTAIKAAYGQIYTFEPT